MKHIKNNVYWTGKIDWELRNFHGHELSTHRGSTYNSYLIKEKKIVLIDTVWSPFSDEFVKNLSDNMDLNKIDLIVANHGEIDHSGALVELMEYIPDIPIYCTSSCAKTLKGNYHKNWNYNIVKTGDSIDLGGKKLMFLEAPMLHWPDSMFCYLTGDNILFSNDAFGQHYATDFLFNDLVHQNELFEEAIKYYANILTPFSSLVLKKIQQIKDLDLSVDMICTSHGVIWRKNPMQIIKKYLEWADHYKENKISIVYETMWDGTRIMAENIAKGIRKADKKTVIKLYNVAKDDKSDIITEVFKSKGVLFGSPTINRGILSGIAGALEEIKRLRFKGKRAAAFGSYGWSGESVAMLNQILESGGFEVCDEGKKVHWKPDDNEINDCVKYGMMIADKFNK